MIFGAAAAAAAENFFVVALQILQSLARHLVITIIDTIHPPHIEIVSNRTIRDHVASIAVSTLVTRLLSPSSAFFPTPSHQKKNVLHAPPSQPYMMKQALH